MDKAGTAFFMAWLLCGCSIDNALDDWRACVVAVAALIVSDRERRGDGRQT